MPEPAARYLGYLGIALAAFVAIAGGLEIVARVGIGGQALARAASETAHYATVQPVGTLMAFAPFAAVAWICASLARVSRRRAMLLMTACVAILALLYYGGYADSQRFMQQRAWTAAALAAGLLPFKSIPVVVIALVLRLFWGRKRAIDPTPPR